MKADEAKRVTLEAIYLAHPDVILGIRESILKNVAEGKHFCGYLCETSTIAEKMKYYFQNEGYKVESWFDTDRIKVMW